MTSLTNDAARRLIPRWRYTSARVAAAETIADRPRADQVRIDEGYWQQKYLNWQAEPSAATAADLVACAGVLHRYADAKDAIAYLKPRGSDLSPATSDLVAYAATQVEGASGTRVDKDSDPDHEPEGYVSGQLEAREVIARSRKRLHATPRDALGWMDMARAYTTLGQSRQAEAAMNRALLLAPDHRLVLRAECRRLVHAGRADDAHRVILRSPRAKHDPWLIAAEIATAQVLKRSPRLAREGIVLLESGRFSPAGITELAGALGTLEYLDGAPRRTRHFFRLSMEAPSDNSVAQARWVAARTSGIEISESAWRTPQSFEAWCWRAYQMADWDRSLAFAKAWVRDEPFSSRAAVNATFVATTVNEDYDFAIACARDVLVADPADLMLRNNLVVALAYADRVQEARQECDLLPSAGNNEQTCVLLATQGLVEYRSGAVDVGRALYRRAFDCAPQALKLRVVSHWIKEEIRLSSEDAEPVLAQLARVARAQREPVSLRVLELVHRSPARKAGQQSSDAQINRGAFSDFARLLQKIG